MPEVTGYTTEKVDSLVADSVVDGAIDDETGALTLTTKSGTIIPVGSVATGISNASTDAPGIVELATDTETQAGTDSTRAITPLGLSAVVATATAKGLVELATDAEAISGADASRAVTPHALAAAIAALALASQYQPLDAQLTQLAALSPANGDFIQQNSGVLANRTPAQAASSLSGVGMPISYYSTGSGYSAVSGPAIYVGPTDPGSVANGSIWLDTTGT